MSFLSFLFGRRKSELESTTSSRASERHTVKPARGTILVRKGTPAAVRQAIEAHASLFKKKVPREFRVTLTQHLNGSVVLQFPDGAAPYEFVNLIGWLSDPPDMPGVSDALGWITSPSSGIRYSLKPETDNEWGDTLVGSSSEGQFVRVYLPEASLCEISQVVRTESEPDPGTLMEESQIAFSIVMDVAAGFGNPEFRITHPKDTNWNPEG